MTGVGGGGGCNPAGSGWAGSLAGSRGSSGGGVSWNGDGVDVTGGRGWFRNGAASEAVGGAFLVCAFNRSRAVVAAFRTSSFLS